MRSIVADLLKTVRHTNDARSELMEAEVGTPALATALCLGGNNRAQPQREAWLTQIFWASLARVAASPDVS